MSRHTAFRFTVDPSPDQVVLLARHAGASRFAYNQCLRLVKDALTARAKDSTAHLSRALAAYSASRRDQRPGRRVGFPRFKGKGRDRQSFRIRQKTNGARGCIRLGEDGARRLISLSGPSSTTLRPGTSTHGARSSTLPEGTALAHTYVWVKPAPVTEEPDHHTQPGRRWDGRPRRAVDHESHRD